MGSSSGKNKRKKEEIQRQQQKNGLKSASQSITSQAKKQEPQVQRKRCLKPTNEPTISSSFRLGDLLNMAVFNELGYELAHKSTLIQEMENIRPSGNTAMRDAFICGCKTLIQLSAILQQLGVLNSWHFVHILLTDGEDNRSETTHYDVLQQLYSISNVIPSQLLKNIFIGVGLTKGSTSENQLLEMATRSGQNGEYYNVEQNQIEQIFSIIGVQLGLIQESQIMVIQEEQAQIGVVATNLKPVLQIKEKHYVVMFDIDISGSMCGNK